MILAESITLGGDYSAENVQIFSREESLARGIKDYFEDAQLLLKCKEGTFLVPKYIITIIKLSSSRRKLKENISRKVGRICISGNIIHDNCYLLHPLMHAEAGIPLVFKDYEQFAFACNDGLFITTDYNVRLIEL
jgi:hypothetical protein